MLTNSYFLTGAISLGLSLFLFLVGIPFSITSPSGVTNIVLSPVFWPEVLAGILGLVGVALMLTAKSATEVKQTPEPGIKGGYRRLTVLAVLLGAYVMAIPKLGMVWSSMLAFVSLALLIRTHHRIAAFVAAILVPLVLYVFFAHVAGVAIPQGDFVRLP